MGKRFHIISSLAKVKCYTKTAKVDSLLLIIFAMASLKPTVT